MTDPTSGWSPSGGPGGNRGELTYGMAVQRSGLAVGALVCGIVGVLTAIVGIGMLVGIVAIVLGAVALVQIAQSQGRTRGKGMAITGLILGAVALMVAPVVLLIAILLPSLGRARELANRSACAANLRGLSQSMLVYAYENADLYPVVPYAPYGPGNAGVSTQNTGASDTTTAMHFLYTSGSSQNGSPLAGQWMLVLSDQVAPKGFLCKSDPFVKGPAEEMGAGGYNANFQREDQISYSFAYPYEVTRSGAEVGDWWKNRADSSLPVASDMAPLNGTGSPARDVGAVIVSGSVRQNNSGNHLGDGQNVAFADGHAEFCRRPDVGQLNDNIYTYGASGATATGVQPTQAPILLQPRPPFDMVMVPARNLRTGSLW